MNINDIMKVILEVAGEKLSQRVNIDGLEDKLKICKDGIKYIEAKASFYTQYKILSNLDNYDGIELDDKLKKFLRDKVSTNIEENDKLGKEIIKAVDKDYKAKLRSTFTSPCIKGFFEIDNKLLFKKIVKLNKEELKFLGLRESDVELLENKLLFYEDIDKYEEETDEDRKVLEEDMNVSDPDSYENKKYFRSRHMSNEELDRIDEIKIILRSTDIKKLERFDLDLLFYDSYEGRLLHSKSYNNPNNAISNFLLNNADMILYNKNIMDEVNNRIGFKLCNCNPKVKIIYELIFDSSYIKFDDEDQEKLYNGAPELSSRLNKLYLIAAACDKYGDDIIERIKEIDREIDCSYDDRLSNKFLYDYTVMSTDGLKPSSDDFSEYKMDQDIKAPDLFGTLFGDENLAKSKMILKPTDKQSLIFDDVVNPRGTFKGLTPNEIANILIEYFIFNTNNKLLSKKDDIAFKDLSYMTDLIIENRETQNTDLIIENRETQNDIISEFSHNYYEFPEKQEIKKLD